MAEEMRVWEIPLTDDTDARKRGEELRSLFCRHIGNDFPAGYLFTWQGRTGPVHDARIRLKESEQLWTDSAAVRAKWDYENSRPKKVCLSSMPYRDYLQTPEWKATAKRKRQQAGNRCQVCNASGVQLDVHHRTYANRGHELDEDLIVLCHECHGIFESAGKLKVGND